VDLESIAWAPLDYAAWLASGSGAIVDIFYALPQSSGAIIEKARCDDLLVVLATLTQRFSQAATRPAGSSEPIFVGNMQPGDPAQIILEFAERLSHDVIVMGSHNHAPLTHQIRGSVAEKVVRRANSPVLVVPTARIDDLYGVHAPI
jgi:nucleotide-binding universal stress UspA family protein